MKIGFIAPNMSPALGDMIGCVAREMEVELVLGYGHFEDALSWARRLLLEQPDVEAIIARNNTAAYLRERLDIPVVSLELTNFDVARTLSRVRDKEGRFLIFQFLGDPVMLDIEGISEVCGIELTTAWLQPGIAHDYAGLAEELGCRKVVASVALVAEPCRAAGKEVYLIEIAEEEVRRSFQRSLITIGVRRREQVKTERFRQSLDTVRDGFVAIDETGRVAVFNHRMELIMGIHSREILGLDQEEAIACFPFLREVFAARDEDLLECNGETYSVARESYMVDGLLLREIVRLISVPEIQKMEGNLRKKLMEKGFKAKNTFRNLYAECPSMRALKEKALRYAASSSSVLITGESGTGKEVLAQSIHNASPFREGPFVAINCAALPETLLESELFGYEEGAFTGARRGGKEGLMELSHRGTLFLDEIGLMPLTFQAKLLRSIQERQICRLGGNRLIPVQNRIICATNRDLFRDVREGSFREDLYYRINVLSLAIPPLRDRGEDVKFLARRLFLKKCREAARYLVLPEPSLDLLLGYDWPGNVRELEGFLERLIVLTEGKTVPETLILELMEETRPHSGGTGLSLEGGMDLLSLGGMEEIQKRAIEQAYERYHGRVETAAHALGISRTTLWRRLREYGVAPEQSG